MNIIKDDELIYVNDNKIGINSCGYNVNSLLFNSGISPILTINNKSHTSSSNISSLFDNLVVPNWALHYEPNKTNKTNKTNDEDNYNLEIIDDNLYDKLIDLALYKDTFFNDGGIEINKNKNTKNKNTKNKNTKNKNKNNQYKNNQYKKKQKYKITRKNIK
tara:strand:+ start:224 stop:706 length:483 start_codon:yes stop_codon:yes gene_type:complete